jgi:hypothetical protein
MVTPFLSGGVPAPVSSSSPRTHVRHARNNVSDVTADSRLCPSLAMWRNASVAIVFGLEGGRPS